MKKQIPNILTVIRFFLIPVIIYHIHMQNYIIALLFLTLSGLTDVLDGFIARKYNLITNFGKLIDPLADKATQISVLIILVLEKVIPNWILFVIILKELILIIGSFVLYEKEVVVSSRWYGKLATVLLYLAILSSLLIKQFNISIIFDKYLYYLALTSTLFSLLMYAKAAFNHEYSKRDKKS